MDLYLQIILCAMLTASMVLTTVNAKGGDNGCNNITTEFRMLLEFVSIGNIIGIPNEAEVEIRCDCVTPKRASPDWSYNDDENVTTTENDNDPSYPYVDNEGSQATLKVDSFGEESSGLYACHSRDTTAEFNLIWYDPGDKPQLIVEPMNLNISIIDGNEMAILQCNAFAARTYIWERKDGHSIPDKAMIREGGTILEIPNIKEEDAGDYRCTVENSFGTSSSQYAHVTVTVSFSSINKPSGTIDGFSVTLNWEISSIDLLDSIIISAEWISLLSYSSCTSGKRQITGNTDTVTITDLATTQYTFADLQPFSHYCFTVTALYAFEGQTLGEVTSEPFCTNTSEAVPSAPQDLRVLSQSFTSLTLTWNVPQSPNGIILNYKIRYNDDTRVVAVEDINPSFILSQLLSNTTYDISVSAINGAGEGNYSNIISTNTLSRTTGNPTKGTLLFQIKLDLGGIHSCQTWTNDTHSELIASAVSDLIKMECNCNLEEGAIDQDHLLCDQSQLNRIVFRAEIITYQLTRGDLLIILQNMITVGRLMLNESTVIRIDNNCPVQITSFNDPLCAVPINDNVEDRESTESDEGFPTSAIIGLVIAIIVIIVLLSVLFMLLVLYRRRKSDKYSTQHTVDLERSIKETKGETPPAVLYSAPLSMTVDPDQKECQIGNDGYLIPVSNKTEDTNNQIVEFDDEIYLKSIQNNLACTAEHSNVKMQPNPSYRGTIIPHNDST